MSGRVKLTAQEAIAMLPDGEYVHTFRNPAGMLIGADVKREKLIELFEAHGAELSGETATRMGHGIYVNDGSMLFVATRVAPSEERARGGCGDG